MSILVAMLYHINRRSEASVHQKGGRNWLDHSNCLTRWISPRSFWRTTFAFVAQDNGSSTKETTRQHKTRDHPGITECGPARETSRRAFLLPLFGSFRALTCPSVHFPLTVPSHDWRWDRTDWPVRSRQGRKPLFLTLDRSVHVRSCICTLYQASTPPFAQGIRLVIPVQSEYQQRGVFREERIIASDEQFIGPPISVKSNRLAKASTSALAIGVLLSIITCGVANYVSCRNYAGYMYRIVSSAILFPGWTTRGCLVVCIVFNLRYGICCYVVIPN